MEAICVVFVPKEAVGVVGVPVNAGLAKFAFKFKAVCCAVETGLSASLVLVTKFKPKSIQYTCTIEKNLFKQLFLKAESQGLPVNALVNLYLKEKVI